jgi:putative FmdB family regulatory protein
MPLYEYNCRSCGSAFELLRRIQSRYEAATCPVCGARNAQRRVSTFVVNGWTRGKPRRAESETDAEPDEYELVRTDHSDEEDWADF